MNWIRSLSSALFGGADGESMDIIALDGTFYLDRADKVRGGHECLFPDATASIRRTDDEFRHLLVITRMVDEDDIGSDPEDEESVLNEKVFLISADMRFHTGVLDECSTFRWIEAGGNPDDIYEFAVQPSTNKHMLRAFTEFMMQCLYQQKYLRSHENAAREELEAMLWYPHATAPIAPSAIAPDYKRNNPKSTTPPRQTVSSTVMGDLPDSPSSLEYDIPSTDPTPRPGRQFPDEISPIKPVTSRLAHAQQSQDKALPEQRPRTVSLAALLPRQPHLPDSATLLTELDAEVYIFNAVAREFAQVDGDGPVTAQLWIQPHNIDTSYLIIEGSRGILMQQRIDSDMNHVFHESEWALIWNYYVDGSGAFSLSLKFETLAEYTSFKKEFTKLHVQATLHSSIDAMKLDDGDMDYMMEQVTDRRDHRSARDSNDNLSDDEESDRSDNEDKDNEAVDELGAGTVGADLSDEDEPEPANEPAGVANSLLTTTSNRTYVVRGNKIGVFGYTPRGHVRFETMINKIKYNKAPINPDQIMMHKGERHMIIADKADKSKLYELDIESQSIVNEWKLDSNDVPQILRDMAPDKKSADVVGTIGETFVGITDRAVFRVDARENTHGTVADWDKGAYRYSKNVDLQCIATNSVSNMAVASGKGELRLFTRPGQRAKTTLQGSGEPIRHLDVSLDGRYLLATCNTSLLLFNVAIAGSEGSETAFTSRMPASNRPDAIRLHLKPQHVAQMASATGERLKFTQAYFNVSPKGETNIVTSSGPYVISWSLEDILSKGKRDKYTIKKYADNVVADQFRFGGDTQIVLALPHDVKSVSKNTLKNPNRGL